MAQCARPHINNAALGSSPERFLQIGIMHASGRAAPADLVAAHKWFNLAAVQGNAEAIRLRLEVAGQMSSAEIVTAQCAAREWLQTH
jgi:uncharacterized protein